jgi:hypothetical protein
MLGKGGEARFPLTARKTGNKLDDMKAKQKRMAGRAGSQGEVRRVRISESPAPASSARESRKLLVRAFSHPEGSSERRQAFSEYLNALHDEHAK